MKIERIGLGLVALAVALTTTASSATAASDRAELRKSMRSIYESIRILLPLSVDDDAFRDPANRERIRASLAALVDNASGVAAHSGEDDRGMRYLAGTLSVESAGTLARFNSGEVESAQFFVQRLTDFCVACHSRLPSGADSPVAADFVSKTQLASLPLDRRASLQVATRRFDDAMTTFETLIGDRQTHPAELLIALTEYLTIAIRVKHDLRRPIPTLRKFAARPDLWSQVRGDTEAWIATLESRADEPPAPPTLERARADLEGARSVIQFPSDRRALVHYLLASSEILRWLEIHEKEGSERVAQAYFWLGQVQLRIDGSAWVSQGTFYLETAVRMSPRSETGRQAFALLEEEILMGWTGSQGTHLPEDVAAYLEELRSLVYPEGAAS